MSRSSHTLVLCSLLSSATLLGAGIAAAEPAVSREPPAAAAPAATPPLKRTATDTSPGSDRGPFPGASRRDMPAPITPMPLNLPDDATQHEVDGGYAIGVASLIFLTLVVAAIVVGGLYIVSRHSWSTQH